MQPRMRIPMAKIIIPMAHESGHRAATHDLDHIPDKDAHHDTLHATHQPDDRSESGKTGST
jgi:hypothetical protein